MNESTIELLRYAKDRIVLRETSEAANTLRVASHFVLNESLCQCDNPQKLLHIIRKAVMAVEEADNMEDAETQVEKALAILTPKKGKATTPQGHA